MGGGRPGEGGGRWDLRDCGDDSWCVLMWRLRQVCLIGEGPAFFIAVGAHHEWGHGHTVWGQVEDMNTVDFIVNTLPIKEEVSR